MSFTQFISIAFNLAINFIEKKEDKENHPGQLIELFTYALHKSIVSEGSASEVLGGTQVQPG